jgi:hypothetical protein
MVGRVVSIGGRDAEDGDEEDGEGKAVTTDAAGQAHAGFVEPSLFSSQLPPPPRGCTTRDSLTSIKTGPTGFIKKKSKFEKNGNRKLMQQQPTINNFIPK